MTENEVAKLVVNACYNIHVKLGPGLLESVYEEILFYELKKLVLNVERQKQSRLYGKLSKCLWVSGQI